MILQKLDFAEAFHTFALPGISRKSRKSGKSDGAKTRLRNFRHIQKQDLFRKIKAERADESIRSEESHVLILKFCHFSEESCTSGVDEDASGFDETRSVFDEGASEVHMENYDFSYNLQTSIAFGKQLDYVFVNFRSLFDHI